MRRISSRNVIWIAMLIATVVPTIVAATPAINSAVINTRIYNDCPASVLTTTNSYPALISINDVKAPGCVGFANRHNFRLSADGGTNPAVFNNGDSFRFCADMVIFGDGQAEAGLQISPWWSQNVDGMFNVRTTDGEIACFGGRMPFYSFTGTYGLVYVKGTPIHMEMIYLPNGLSQASPATVEYKLTYNSMNYSSGPLPFDQGNPAEDPPYGQWGMLNDGRVGGHMQYFLGLSQGGITTEWSNLCYEVLVVGVEPRSWGTIKGLYR